jgi:hypothetical protein
LAVASAVGRPRPDGENQLVTIRALLLLGGVSLALAGVASAQSVSSPPASSAPPPAIQAAPSPPPAATNPGMPPQRIAAMVRARGFHPIGSPARHGNLYVQRAFDPDDMEYRLLIDSLTGRIVSVQPLGMAGPYAYGPGPYGPPPYRPVRYWGPPPGDDFGFGRPRPPRAVPTARLAPPQTQPGTAAPSQPSATAPLPRPKPYVMEGTGSIPIDSPEPLPSHKTAGPPPTPAAPETVPAHDNGAAAMPPVAPLD